MEEKYFYLLDNEQYGPFPLVEIRDMHIPPDTLVWYQGMADWQPAHTFPELQDLYIAQPQQPVVVKTENPFVKFFRIVAGVFCFILVIGLIGSGLEEEPITAMPFILAVVFLALGSWLLFKKPGNKNRNSVDNKNEIDGMFYAQGQNMLQQEDSWADAGDFD